MAIPCSFVETFLSVLMSPTQTPRRSRLCVPKLHVLSSALRGGMSGAVASLPAQTERNPFPRALVSRVRWGSWWVTPAWPLLTYEAHVVSFLLPCLLLTHHVCTHHIRAHMAQCTHHTCLSRTRIPHVRALRMCTHMHISHTRLSFSLSCHCQTWFPSRPW